MPVTTVADPGGAEGGHASGPVQISHKKDGRHIDFMFLAPPPPAAGSDAVRNDHRGPWLNKYKQIMDPPLIETIHVLQY